MHRDHPTMTRGLTPREDIPLGDNGHGPQRKSACTVTSKKPTRVAAPSPRASLERRTVCGRTEQRRPPVSKRYGTKVRMVWGSFLIAAAALKTPTRNGFNALGVNLTSHRLLLSPVVLRPTLPSRAPLSSAAKHTASTETPPHHLLCLFARVLYVC